MAATPTVPRSERRFELPHGMVITADAFGSADAPPIVLLHGGGQTRHAWGRTAEAFARAGWYAIAIDQRGHGQSGWDPQGHYRVEDFVKDLRAVIVSLGTKPVLVGASLGGITSLLVATENEPSDAAALILVDVTPRMERDGVMRIIDFMGARPEGYATIDEVADAVANYLPHRKRPKDLLGLEKNLRRGDDGRYRWHWDPKLLQVWTPNNFTEKDGQAIVAERLAAASRLSIPTLLVRGGLSDVVSEENAREFLAHATHAEYVDLRGAAHMVAGDSNERFTEAVLSFARRLAPSRPANEGVGSR